MKIARRMGQALSLILAVAGFAGLSVPMRAQNSWGIDSVGSGVDPVVQRNMGDWIIQGRGVPDDWTYHHLVFSNPGSEHKAIENGTQDHWIKIANNPRYTLQLIQRSSGAKRLESSSVPAAVSPSASGSAEVVFGRGPGTLFPQGSPKPALKKDWSEGLGTGTINPNTYPAVWSSGTSTASCADDFAIYPTGVPGSSTAASIIGYYNLYSGCGGTVPEVDWAYNTGGTVTLSPVFSIDGTQVALIQTSGSVASLVLLKYPLTPPGTGTLGSPITLTSQASATAYTTCAAPCMYTVALSGSPDDTWSSPYYDHATDSLYVGDSTGKLHKFFPVFYGPLAEVTSSWPVQLKHGATNDTNQTNGPVYDSTSGNIFVGTVGTGTGSTGGYLYSVGSGNAGTTSGTIYGASAQLDTFYGIRDSVLIDSNAATVYAFVGYDASGDSGVYQFSTGFTSADINEVETGAGCNTAHLCYELAGTFDNTYYTSSSDTGYLYMGTTNVSGPLYQIAITSNAMGTATSVGNMTTASHNGRFSPITEFYNPNGAVLAAATAAMGTVTIQSDPGAWPAGETVMIGSTTYTYVSSLTAVNQVLLVAGGSPANRENRAAQNLRATILATSADCFAAPCFFTGQTANSSVTATRATNVVTLTSTTTGTAGDFTLGTNYPTGIALGGGLGQNGTDATYTAADLIFFSMLAGSQPGCTNNDSHGCVMAFNVTTPTAVALSGSTLNFPASNAAYLAPTGGLTVDNSVSPGTLAGASQIYYLTTDNSGAVSCTTSGTGICAVQASQTNP